MTNPFTLTFGEPKTMINRGPQYAEIETSFLDAYPSTHIYTMTGVRGIGKTVSLTVIQNSFIDREDWIVIELNSCIPLAQQFKEKLYDALLLMKLNTCFDISDETVTEQMLDAIKDQNKKVLICIDEVTNSKDMKMFLKDMQDSIKNDFPIFLLLVGLPENIETVQNRISCKTSKVFLTNLDITLITNCYKKTLRISEEEASRLAKLSNGYSYAFQLIGDMYYRKHTIDLEELDVLLEERGYIKIWSDLSFKEKQIVEAIIKGNNKTKDIRTYTEMTSGAFSVYRNRLSKKGIIDISTYGHVSFALPRFAEILRNYID